MKPMGWVFGLVNLHAAIFFAPSVIGLLGHSELANCSLDCLAGTEENFCLAEFGNDLFRSVTFPCHVIVHLSKGPFSRTKFMEPVSGGRSNFRLLFCGQS
jgi:hypothetical protein